jgi:hypothetical protein
MAIGDSTNKNPSLGPDRTERGVEVVDIRYGLTVVT